jgi:hypothetical protein
MINQRKQLYCAIIAVALILNSVSECIACTYSNSSNMAPACGGDSGSVIYVCNLGIPPSLPDEVLCSFQDSQGMLANCNGGAATGGAICSAQSTQCSYTRTYSNCNCQSGGTPSPLSVTATVSWPQPSGTCPQ